MTHFAVLFDYGDNLEVKIKAVNLYIEFFWSQFQNIQVYYYLIWNWNSEIESQICVPIKTLR